MLVKIALVTHVKLSFFSVSLSSALENTINTLIVMRLGAKFVLRMSACLHSPHRYFVFPFQTYIVVFSSCPVKSRPGAAFLSFSCGVFVCRSRVTRVWHLAEGMCLLTACGLSPSVIVQTGPSRSAPTEWKQTTPRSNSRLKAISALLTTNK